MAAFEYSALDTVGRTQTGVLEADNPRQVRQQLRDKGLSPIKVAAVADQSAWGIGAIFRPRIGARDLALLTRQLATLVRSGLPVDEALYLTAEQSKPRQQRVLFGVRAKVVEGHSLASGLAQFPRVFPHLFQATITAGEQSGRLDEVLSRLAEYSERRHALQQKVALALFYPILLTMVALGVVAGLLAYVVPQVVQVFDSTHAQLPLLTRVLLRSSELMRSLGPWLLVSAVLAAIGIGAMLRLPQARRRLHGFLLKLPLFGSLHSEMQIARFTRTIGILVASGVEILAALSIAAGVTDNLVLRDAVHAAAARVREGSSLHHALRRTGRFPPILLHLIASGENSGSLDEMLLYAAESQERNLEALISTAVTLFEPLLILIMGGIVLLIVIAILLPVFELNRLIQ